MRWLFKRARGARSGQATVEAALAIPVAFLLLLLLVQPAIVLYDRTVMENAALETCRLLCTSDAGASVAEDFARRRLSAVPEAEVFHKHEGGCSWEITLSGGAGSAEARVKIATRLKPLPLLAQLSRVAGMCDGEGYWRVEVEEVLPVRAPWQ
ncbi:TadE/TadG family type IV pilus assembly protein [Parvibacter caecicola]|uniref:TadE/TadG family type IV pilus assembly protein n=1 Tax=Parvibacter caecicola TaxID=747645 RepID=UPI0023F534C8|nr:TadE family protein [Parvibacter caecicola]